MNEVLISWGTGTYSGCLCVKVMYIHFDFLIRCLNCCFCGISIELLQLREDFVIENIIN